MARETESCDVHERAGELPGRTPSATRVESPRSENPPCQHALPALVTESMGSMDGTRVSGRAEGIIQSPAARASRALRFGTDPPKRQRDRSCLRSPRS